MLPRSPLTIQLSSIGVAGQRPHARDEEPEQTVDTLPCHRSEQPACRRHLLERARHEWGERLEDVVCYKVGTYRS